MIEIALIHEEPWSGDEQSWEVLARADRDFGAADQ